MENKKVDGKGLKRALAQTKEYVDEKVDEIEECEVLSDQEIDQILTEVGLTTS
jgi:enolase